MWWFLLACMGQGAGPAMEPPPWQEAVAAWRHPDPLPPLPFIDDAGQRRTLADLSERWALVGFVFTRCGNAEACPMTMRRLVSVQEALGPDVPLEIVVFTIDPAYDTPERLTAYAESYGADLDRWTLGTGDVGLMREGLPSLFNVYALGEGATTTHPVKLTLLAPGLVEAASWSGAEFEVSAVREAMAR